MLKHLLHLTRELHLGNNQDMAFLLLLILVMDIQVILPPNTLVILLKRIPDILPKDIHLIQQQQQQLTLVILPLTLMLTLLLHQEGTRPNPGMPPRHHHHSLEGMMV